MSYKLDTPGEYYLRVGTYDSGNDCIKPIKLRYEIMTADTLELNDSYAAATDLAFASPVEFSINGVNDTDWFYFETTLPNEVVNFYIRDFETDYSNQIRYDLYDANADGTVGARLDNNTLNMTWSKVYGFNNIGGHYLQITSDHSSFFENKLTLWLEQGVVDEGEPNDNWNEATPLAAGLGKEYKLPSTSDVDWFVFHANEPNQTVELTSFVPAGGESYVQLYRGENFALYGDNASRTNYWYLGAGTKSVRVMLGEPGDYYIRISPNSSRIFSENGTIRYDLIEPDDNENNASWKTATALSQNVDMPFTLPADNDVDWFRFTVNEPDQTLEFTLFVPAGGDTYVELYSGERFINSGDNASRTNYWYLGAGTNTVREMLGEPGDYYLRITSHYSSGVFTEAGTIRYDLIEPDANENNYSWKTAAALTQDVDLPYTLPASNDVDWFRLTVTEPNQTLDVTTFVPAGGEITVDLYRGEDFITSGDNAYSMNYWYLNAGTGSIRYMVQEPGDYYLRITPHYSKVFTDSATIRYDLIEPDAYEWNGGFIPAASLHAGTRVYFTLPASNDHDWFRLDNIERGDKDYVTGSFPASVRVSLEDVDTGATDISHYDYCYLSGTAVTHTFTANYEGDYYLYLSPNYWNANHGKTMWITYYIVRDGMDVTGVELLNSATDIRVGQTMQLTGCVTPSNAAEQRVTWSSSNTDAATVDGSGLVTAVAPGTTRITLTSVQGGYTNSFTLTVLESIHAEGVTVTCGDVMQRGETAENPKALALGTTLLLTAQVFPAETTDQTVVWTVSDSAVLAVTDYGRVAAIGSGSAYVTVTTSDGGYSAKFWVNVPDESYPVTSITMTPLTDTIYMGEGGTDLTAIVNPSYATNPGVIWRSENESVATVDQNGHVTPVAPGYADILAVSEENSAINSRCAISVQPVRTRVTGVRFAETDVNVGLYGTVQLETVVSPANATDKTVTYSSNNTNVATVSRTGVVTALNLGIAQITVTTKDGSYSATMTIHVSSNASLGDVSNDGVVDSADAMLILRYCVNLIALSDAQKAVADLNDDGYIDAGDAVLILRYDAGLIDSFPAERR